MAPRANVQVRTPGSESVAHFSDPPSVHVSPTSCSCHPGIDGRAQEECEAERMASRRLEVVDDFQTPEPADQPDRATVPERRCEREVAVVLG